LKSESKGESFVLMTTRAFSKPEKPDRPKLMAMAFGLGFSGVWCPACYSHLNSYLAAFVLSQISQLLENTNCGDFR